MFFWCREISRIRGDSSCVGHTCEIFFITFVSFESIFWFAPAAIIIADAGQRARGPYIEMSFRRENKCDRKFGAFILLVRRVFCISIHQQWRQWPSPPPPLRLLPVLSAACKKNAHRSRRRPSSRSCSLSAFSGEFAFYPRIAFRRAWTWKKGLRIPNKKTKVGNRLGSNLFDWRYIWEEINVKGSWTVAAVVVAASWLASARTLFLWKIHLPYI